MELRTLLVQIAIRLDKQLSNVVEITLANDLIKLRAFFLNDVNEFRRTLPDPAHVHVVDKFAAIRRKRINIDIYNLFVDSIERILLANLVKRNSMLGVLIKRKTLVIETCVLERSLYSSRIASVHQLAVIG